MQIKPFPLHPSLFPLHPPPFTLHSSPFPLHPSLFTKKGYVLKYREFNSREGK